MFVENKFCTLTEQGSTSFQIGFCVDVIVYESNFLSSKENFIIGSQSPCSFDGGKFSPLYKNTLNSNSYFIFIFSVIFLLGGELVAELKRCNLHEINPQVALVYLGLIDLSNFSS